MQYLSFCQRRMSRCGMDFISKDSGFYHRSNAFFLTISIAITNIIFRSNHVFLCIGQSQHLRHYASLCFALGVPHAIMSKALAYCLQYYYALPKERLEGWIADLTLLYFLGLTYYIPFPKLVARSTR